MSGTGQKVCGGGGWWVVVVETNHSVKLKLKLNNISKYKAVKGGGQNKGRQLAYRSE